MAIHRFAMMGDTNGQPTESGRYSNRWVANEIPCDYVIPDAGKHGRIDSIWTNCTIMDFGRIAGKNPDLDRLPGGGSDHGLIVGKIRSPSTSVLRFAFWNVERDRKGRQIDQMIEFLKSVIYRYNLNFVCLNEAEDYHHVLRRLSQRTGMKMYANRTKGKDHNVILASKKLTVTNPTFPRVSRDGWITESGHPHEPIHLTAVTINGWLRLACIHNVPSVDVRNGKLSGPPLRQKVWKQSQTFYVKYGKRFS